MTTEVPSKMTSVVPSTSAAATTPTIGGQKYVDIHLRSGCCTMLVHCPSECCQRNQIVPGPVTATSQAPDRCSCCSLDAVATKHICTAVLTATILIGATLIILIPCLAYVAAKNDVLSCDITLRPQQEWQTSLPSSAVFASSLTDITSSTGGTFEIYQFSQQPALLSGQWTDETIATGQFYVYNSIVTGAAVTQFSWLVHSGSDVSWDINCDPQQPIRAFVTNTLAQQQTWWSDAISYYASSTRSFQYLAEHDAIDAVNSLISWSSHLTMPTSDTFTLILTSLYIGSWGSTAQLTDASCHLNVTIREPIYDLNSAESKHVLLSGQDLTLDAGNGDVLVIRLPQNATEWQNAHFQQQFKPGHSPDSLMLYVFVPSIGSLLFLCICATACILSNTNT